MENTARKDLNNIVKVLGLKQVRNGKGQLSYRCYIELINGKSTEIFANKEEFDLVLMLKNIKGESYKEKVLVDDYSDSKDKVYTCIRFTLTDGTILRYMPSNTFNKIIDLTYEQYLADSKKQK